MYVNNKKIKFLFINGFEENCRINLIHFRDKYYTEFKHLMKYFRKTFINLSIFFLEKFHEKIRKI